MQISLSTAVAAMLCVVGGAKAQPAACTIIDRPGYVIEKPGNYCMVKDLFTRLDFADHSAEVAIAEIRSSNVTVDMQGHRGGRARGPFQAGGNGFTIANISGGESRYTNIVIKNGVLSDFDYGIYFYAFMMGREPVLQSLQKVASSEFVYKRANIRVIDVRFDKCKEDFHFVDAL